MQGERINIRISSQDKVLLQELTRVTPYVKNMSEYLISLVRSDMDRHHESMVYAVPVDNLQSEPVLVGSVLVDSDGIISRKAYEELVVLGTELVGSECYLVVNGDIVPKPARYVESVIVE